MTHLLTIQPANVVCFFLDNKSVLKGPCEDISLHIRHRNQHSHPQPGFSHLSSAAPRAQNLSQHQLPAPPP